MAVLALVLLWAAATYRLVITVRDPPSLWRWSFTLAVCLVALGATAWTFPAAVGRVLGPSTASLVNHVATTAAGGLVSVYLLTLLTARPSRRAIALCTVPAVATVAVQIVSWWAAPVHRVDYVDIALAPFTAAMLVYSISYYGYLTVVLSLTATLTARLSLRSQGDQSRRIGLIIISASTGVAGVALVLFIIRALIRYQGGDALAMALFGARLAPIALSGLGLATILFLVGPHVEAWLWSRRLASDLHPLWQRLRESHPEISLEPSSAQEPAGTVREQSERMMIEIHDGLTRVVVAPAADPGVYSRIAGAIVGGGRGGSGRTAAELLPAGLTRQDDERVLRALAGAYREASSASDTRATTQ